LPLRSVEVALVDCFGSVLCMEDRIQLRAILYGWQIQFTPVEWNLVPEADNDDPLAVLRYEVLPIDYFPADVIAEIIPKHVENCGERPALVVADEVLDVFQKKCFRSFGFDDASDI